MGISCSAGMKVLPWFWVGPTPLLGARLGELALAARGDPGFTTGVEEACCAAEKACVASFCEGLGAGVAAPA